MWMHGAPICSGAEPSSTKGRWTKSTGRGISRSSTRTGIDSVSGNHCDPSKRLKRLLASADCQRRGRPRAEPRRTAKAPAVTAPTTQQARKAVERGLDFVVKDAVKWRTEENCATC